MNIDIINDIKEISKILSDEKKNNNAETDE